MVRGDVNVTVSVTGANFVAVTLLEVVVGSDGVDVLNLMVLRSVTVVSVVVVLVSSFRQISAKRNLFFVHVFIIKSCLTNR